MNPFVRIVNTGVLARLDYQIYGSLRAICVEDDPAIAHYSTNYTSFARAAKEFEQDVIARKLWICRALADTFSNVPPPR